MKRVPFWKRLEVESPCVDGHAARFFVIGKRLFTLLASNQTLSLGSLPRFATKRRFKTRFVLLSAGYIVVIMPDDAAVQKWLRAFVCAHGGVAVLGRSVDGLNQTSRVVVHLDG